MKKDFYDELVNYKEIAKNYGMSMEQFLSLSTFHQHAIIRQYIMIIMKNGNIEYEKQNKKLIKKII